MNIYVYIDNQQQGPYSLEDVQQMYRDGKIAGDTLVWYDALTEWKPFAQVIPLLSDSEAKSTRKKWLVPVIAGVAVLLALGLGIMTVLFITQKGQTAQSGSDNKSSTQVAKDFTPVAPKKFTGNVDCGNGVTLEMVKIPAGSFVREDGRTVKLTKDFWLGKYEVRQAEYEALMGENPSNFKGGNLPVECVSWHDAQKFCDKLNEKYRDRLPAGYKFALPTEAQWEYACRAGTTTNFSYGNASDTGKMNFDGNYPYGGGDKGIYRKSTVPVGSLGYKNDFGLYDMHGNVWEWCADWYGAYTADTTDPVGPTSGSSRVMRGGGWCLARVFAVLRSGTTSSRTTAASISASASRSSQFNNGINLSLS